MAHSKPGDQQARLTVTPAGLVYQNFLRRKVLSWAEIQSFDVGPSRGMIRWPSLVISRKDGTLLVTSLASYTRTYPTRVAHELTAWQQKLAPFAPSRAAPYEMEISLTAGPEAVVPVPATRSECHSVLPMACQ